MKFNYLQLAVVASLVVVNVASATVNIDLVPVGDVGNANDPATGYGQVNYAYNIGKFDVTAGQYTAFLNAVATTSDPQGLYNSQMVSDTIYGCGIAQTYNSGTNTYSYTTTKNANFPVNYVSFWDSCRFTNWLQNKQPTGVNEGVGTTETGAYDLTNLTFLTNNTVTRSPGTTWAVSSENEWYKAAYYDSSLSGGAGGYWLYPTKSNTVPSNVLSATGTNNANYCSRVCTDPTNFLTPVGAFAASPSPYGTFDQGGDVFQWNDAVLFGLARGLRGGSFGSLGDYWLQSGSRNFSNYTWGEFLDTGFRVVQVPEPASLGILGLGIIGILARRRKSA